MSKKITPLELYEMAKAKGAENYPIELLYVCWEGIHIEKAEVDTGDKAVYLHVADGVE